MEETCVDIATSAQYNTFTFWLWQDYVQWATLAVTAQAVFALRFLWQWVASERRKRSVVPSAFWYFSLAGGLMLSVYALFRDPVILVSAAPSVVIYARNIILIRKVSTKSLLRIGLPGVVALAGFSGLHYRTLVEWFWANHSWFGGPEGCLWTAFGMAAQTVFFMRFVWQWMVSERRKESVLPVSFWYFSLAGGLMISLYATFRDPWILPGQLSGLVVYVRNLVLIHQTKTGGATSSEPPRTVEPGESRQKLAAA